MLNGSGGEGSNNINKKTSERYNAASNDVNK